VASRPRVAHRGGRGVDRAHDAPARAGPPTDLYIHRPRHSWTWRHLYRALGVNNCGQVVGEASVTGASPTHPFIWRDSNGNLFSDAGEMKDLGSLGGARGLATDINASGLVVGTSTILNGDERAFRWFDLDGDGTSDPGEMNDLGCCQITRIMGLSA